MKKSFDCVEMKRRAQERIYEETRGLSRHEQVRYFQEEAAKAWKEIRALADRRATATSGE